VAFLVGMEGLVHNQAFVVGRAVRGLVVEIVPEDTAAVVALRSAVGIER